MQLHDILQLRTSVILPEAISDGDWLPPLILACFSPPIEVGVISHLIYCRKLTQIFIKFEKRTLMLSHVPFTMQKTSFNLSDIPLKTLSRFLQVCCAFPSMRQISNLHLTFILKRNRNNIFSIQIPVDHTTADGISVQSDQQIKKRRPVTDTNVFLPLRRGKNFFRKIKRIVFSLLKERYGYASSSSFVMIV